MKNKVFTVTVFTGKTVRIIFNEKVQSYYIELSDLRKLFGINLKELPAKYQGNLYYLDIKINGKVKKLSAISEDDLEIVKNFSKDKDADNYFRSILTIVNDLKTSYSGYIKGMFLEQEEQDNLINSLEKTHKKINILEGQIEDLKVGAKLFFEFTDNTTLLPLKKVVEKLKYKTTYIQMMGHLRQCGALLEDSIPAPSLIENGCFKTFVWSTKIGDKEKKTTQIVVSQKGIKYINEILEKANGKGLKK